MSTNVNMRESTHTGLETWRRLIEQLPDAVLCVDACGKVHFENPNAINLLGYDSDEFARLEVSAMVFDAVHQHALDAAVLTQLARSGESREVLIKRKDLSLIPALLSVSSFNLSDLANAHLVLLKDIRQLKLSETSFHREKKLLEILLNNINEAVFLAPITAEGVHGNFVEVNDVASRRLGYSKQELLNMNARTINPAANLGRVKAFGKHIRREMDTIFEAIHVAKDGTQIPVEVVAKIIGIDGQDYVLSVVRDLREHKRLQQSEARFGRLIDHSWEEIYIFDSESLRFLQVTQGAMNNL
ncbi:MAG: hypothetical protein AMJ53_16975, partial [Gammaproteobacteria bacterium SG8_11]